MKKALIIILTLLLGFPLLGITMEKHVLSEREKVIKLITDTAKKEGVDVNFCLAIGRIESDFNAQAFNDNTFNFTKNSKVDAVKYGTQEKYVSRGVMQLTFDTGRSYNKKIKTTKDLYNAKENIIAGVKFIKDLFKKYPTLPYTEIAQLYNLGETAYGKGKRNTDYVNKFMRKFMEFSNAK